MAFSSHCVLFCLFSSPRLLSPAPPSELPSYVPSSFLSGRKISLIPANFSSFRLYRRASMASVITPLDAATKRDSEIIVFENEEDLSDSLAKYTGGLSKKFCSERGAFTVVLSGGSLVKSLRKLVESPQRDSIDWGKWHVFWVDERVVPKDHPDSNYKLAFDCFLSKVQIPRSQVYGINDSLPAAGVADDYEDLLKRLLNEGVLRACAVTGVPKFDLLLLGMGPDGHVASLFPGHPLLFESQRWVAFTADSPKPPPERITLTLPVINSSANAALVVTGAGKADALFQAASAGQNSSDLLPVQMVKLRDGALTWFVDKAAATKL